jgi:8-oxo-dGTP pyrophosphatase MutT (NUDIX family)
MYKVFFNDRVVVLTDDFIRNFQVKYGLFYKYKDVTELKELLSFYWDLKQIDTLFIFHHDIDELRERFRSCFQPVNAAGGLVRNEAGQYLIMKRRGKWDLPKGKVNRNEKLQDAALREVSEETGLTDLKIINPLLATYHSYFIDDDLILKRTSWYEMEFHGFEKPTPEIEEDITEIRWVNKDDLHKITDNTYLAIVDVLKYSNLL